MTVSAAMEPAALCGGTSPAISWSGQPEEAGSFALTLVSPSAQGPWVHWMAWDIPADQDALPLTSIFWVGSLRLASHVNIFFAAPGGFLHG